MQYLCLFNSLPHVSFLNFFCPKEEWVHFRRQNGEYILYFITEGEMYLREDGKEHVLREGDAFLLQPGLLHEGTKAARCAYHFAHFNNLSLLPSPCHGGRRCLRPYRWWYRSHSAEPPRPGCSSRCRRLRGSSAGSERRTRFCGDIPDRG